MNALNRLIQWSWRRKALIETPVKLMFLLLLIYIGAMQIYGVETGFKWLWLIPIGLNLSLFESMWNPFRILCILAIWGVAMGLAIQSWIVCIAAVLIMLVGVVGWFYLIQKPSDAALDHHLRERKRQLSTLKSNV